MIVHAGLRQYPCKLHGNATSTSWYLQTQAVHGGLQVSSLARGMVAAYPYRRQMTAVVAEIVPACRKFGSVADTSRLLVSVAQKAEWMGLVAFEGLLMAPSESNAW